MANDSRVDIDAERVAALLSTRLAPAIEAAAMGVAAAVQNELAPYPRARARRPGKGYYIRGRGSFTSRGKLIRASEMLNRRWAIRSITLGARLVNTASYAGYVHGRNQSRTHAQTGWVRVDTAITTVLRSGEASRIVLAAIAEALKGRRP
jgi:hypothetical protein